MPEKAVLYKSGEHTLFGVLTSPEGGRGKGVGMVIVHPFAEEKLIAHRCLVTFARTMASAGYHVLRFDFMGHGDSEGNWEDATVRTRLGDILCSVDFLRGQSGCPKVGIVGFRFGATLAALASAGQARPDFLVLVAPIISGQAYMDQCLRSNLTTQMTVLGGVTRDRKDLVEDLMDGRPVNIDGYLLTGALYREIAGIDISSSPPPQGVPVSVITIASSTARAPSAGHSALSGSWSPREGLSIEQIRESSFWKDEKEYRSRLEATEGTVLRWLDAAFQGGGR